MEAMQIDVNIVACIAHALQELLHMGQCAVMVTLPDHLQALYILQQPNRRSSGLYISQRFDQNRELGVVEPPGNNEISGRDVCVHA